MKARHNAVFLTALCLALFYPSIERMISYTCSGVVPRTLSSMMTSPERRPMLTYGNFSGSPLPASVTHSDSISSSVTVSRSYSACGSSGPRSDVSNTVTSRNASPVKERYIAEVAPTAPVSRSMS